MEGTTKNKVLATDLLTLATMCANEGTDTCDITLTTSRGKIKCHIEFSDVEDSQCEMFTKRGAASNKEEE